MTYPCLPYLFTVLIYLCCDIPSLSYKKEGRAVIRYAKIDPGKYLWRPERLIRSDIEMDRVPIYE